MAASMTRRQPEAAQTYRRTLALLAVFVAALTAGRAFATAPRSEASGRALRGLSRVQHFSQRNQGSQTCSAGLFFGLASLAVLGGRSATNSLRLSGKVRTSLRAVADSVAAGKAVKLFSPAKVNLFLRILRRRPDGYHDLASLFHTVAFGDTMDIEVLPKEAERDELQCNLPGVPVDDSNLVIRALKLFREKSGVERFFGVRLEKRIPAQAGMGGGSSNAATAFFGANQLCGSPATPEDLLKWGDDPVIGSDATFFLSEGTAYCTGRGEIVTPVEALPVRPGLAVYLVKPRYGLSTPKVFKALDLSALSTVEPEELLKTFEEKGTSHSAWVNDLEKPAFVVSPELGALKDFLAGEDFGFEAVLMSGSGSTIYCLGEPSGGAEAFEAATKQRFEIEGIWRTKLMRRASPTEWYSEAAA
eukprot:TRINITY_DN54115_c0_g1_i1.p1 TRINITY_DN54115_c0_g1~~TRINITY_DN54115_c0_g1_i1.p1  ORF type:complete len:417 (-),score=113.04 TRINITY_DN54115_c0_g1_i1:52-1302(-)